MMVEVVLLTGTVGAGKTTTAEALSRIEGDHGIRHGLVDLDHLRRLRPSPPGDPWNLEVGLANLAAVGANYRAAGATRLIVAGVVESAADLARLRGAVATPALFVVQLTVDPLIARSRLARRHHDAPAERDWHLRRTEELTAALAQVDFHDLVLDTTGRSPVEVAEAVRAAAGWSAEGERRGRPHTHR